MLICYTLQSIDFLLNLLIKFSIVMILKSVCYISQLVTWVQENLKELHHDFSVSLYLPWQPILPKLWLCIEDIHATFGMMQLI